MLTMHRDILEGPNKLEGPPAAPDARALVMQVRAELIALFADLGVASNQIGRAYLYASVLRPAPRTLLHAIKRAVDLKWILNPGALELF